MFCFNQGVSSGTKPGWAKLPDLGRSLATRQWAPFSHAAAKDRSENSFIIITAYGDIPMAVQAIKEGAINFLSKPVRERDLLDAVREALDHDKVRRDAHKRLLDLRARYASLTTREQTVMGLICAGLMNKQIASELGVAEITAKTCRHNIMKKLNAKSVPALVRMAQRLEIRE